MLNFIISFDICKFISNLYWGFSVASLKAGCAEFGRLHFYFVRNQFVRRTSSGHYKFFTRYSKGAVLLNITWPRKRAQAYGKSATGAGRIIGPLSGGSTRTCDQSDLRKRHIHFGRRNTSA